MLSWVRKALRRAMALPPEISPQERHDRFLRRCVGLPDGRLCPRDIQGRFSVAMRPRRDKGRVDDGAPAQPPRHPLPMLRLWPW